MGFAIVRDYSCHALPLAYQWWLRCDSYYVSALRSKPAVLDESWVKEIGGTYQVIRTIADGSENHFANLISDSGQSDEMDLMERAARLSNAIENRDASLGDQPVSAATKLSWFLWPQGWTMYDRYAAKAVIGSPSETGLLKMERFYSALAMRGWDDVLGKLRNVLSAHGFTPLLAERTLDKYLFLEGSQARPRQLAVIEGFLAALPADTSAHVVRLSEAMGPVLAKYKLLHRDNATDRQALKARVGQLRQLKKEVA